MQKVKLWRQKLNWRHFYIYLHILQHVVYLTILRLRNTLAPVGGLVLWQRVSLDQRSRSTSSSVDTSMSDRPRARKPSWYVTSLYPVDQ